MLGLPFRVKGDLSKEQIAAAQKALDRYVKEYLGVTDAHIGRRYDFVLREVHEQWDQDRFSFDVVPVGGKKLVGRWRRITKRYGKVPGGVDRIEKTPGLAYRGMAFEEWQEAKKRGVLGSRGYYNIGQEGLTFFSPDPDTAAHYASGFAPIQYKPGPAAPAIVVAVPENLLLTSKDRKDIPQGELATDKPIPLSQVEGVWKLQPEEATPGFVEVVVKANGSVGEGSRASPGHWNKIVRLQDSSEELPEPLGRAPAGWWKKRAPKREGACYPTKTDALNVFAETNYQVIQNYGGMDYQVGVSEFDAVNHKYGAKARTIADALWAALPKVKRPFCLDDIDIEALNDTSPARESDVGFRLPDWAEEARLLKEQEAWYREQGDLGMAKQLAARWATRGGKFWIELYKSPDGYSYRSDSGGGNLGPMSHTEAVAEMERRVRDARTYDKINMQRESGVFGKAAQKKIVGTFCERTLAPKGSFDPRSFRWKKSGTSWLLIGCPKGQWSARKKTCKVGTKAHKILSRTRKGRRCKRGSKRIRKAS
jgi:hypothetical protein